MLPKNLFQSASLLLSFLIWVLFFITCWFLSNQPKLGKLKSQTQILLNLYLRITI
jgi:hypothetical protein